MPQTTSTLMNPAFTTGYGLGRILKSMFSTPLKDCYGSAAVFTSVQIPDQVFQQPAIVRRLTREEYQDWRTTRIKDPASNPAGKDDSHPDDDDSPFGM